MKWFKNILDWFNSLSSFKKILIAIVTGILTAVLFLKIKNNFLLKKDVQYKLDKVKKEMEIMHLNDKAEDKYLKIKELEREEEKLKAAIEFIEHSDINGIVLSPDDLEHFFRSRGF